MKLKEFEHMNNDEYDGEGMSFQIFHDVFGVF